MAWVLHAMTVVASSNVPPAVQPSARVMLPETVTPGPMLVVGSVEVTAVPDEAVEGAGSTAGAGSVTTTDGCAVVSDSSPQAPKAANTRTMTIARKNRFFTSALFDEDFRLLQ